MIRQRLLASPPYDSAAREAETNELVERLCAAQVAHKVDKRLAVFEDLRRQHRDRRKTTIKTAVSTAALSLSLSFSAMSLPRSCRGSQEDWQKCGQSAVALFNTLLFFGVSVWGFWDLYWHPVRYRDFLYDGDEEFARSVQRKRGDVPVDRIFQRLDRMSGRELRTFKQRLHAALAATPSNVGIRVGLANETAGQLSRRASLEEDPTVNYDQYFGQIED